MSIAVIDYTEQERVTQKERSEAKKFIEDVVLQNLNEQNDKVLFSITDSGVFSMPEQHKITSKRINSGIVNQIFHLAKEYGISSKMIFNNQLGDMLCEFW